MTAQRPIRYLLSQLEHPNSVEDGQTTSIYRTLVKTQEVHVDGVGLRPKTKWIRNDKIIINKEDLDKYDMIFELEVFEDEDNLVKQKLDDEWFNHLIRSSNVEDITPSQP